MDVLVKVLNNVVGNPEFSVMREKGLNFYLSTTLTKYTKKDIKHGLY